MILSSFSSSVTKLWSFNRLFGLELVSWTSAWVLQLLFSRSDRCDG